MGKMRVKGKETGIVVRLWINDGAHAGIWRERNAMPEAQRSGSGLPSPVVLLRVRRALRRDAMSPAERTEAARTGETGGVTIPPAGALAITKAAPGASRRHAIDKSIGWFGEAVSITGRETAGH